MFGLLNWIKNKVSGSTITKKVLLSGIVLFITTLIGLSFIFEHSMQTLLSERESDNIKNHAHLAGEILKSSLDFLPGVTEDWAVWENTYEYVRGNFDKFLEYNLNEYPFQIFDLDFITLLDLDGNIIYEKFDPQTRQTYDFDFSGIYAKLGPLTTNAIIDTKAKNLGVSGMLMQDKQLIYISAYPIMDEDRTGPCVGSLVFGRYIYEQDLAFLDPNLKIKFSIQNTSDLALSKEQKDALNENTLLALANNKEVTAYKQFSDIFGNDVLVLSASGPRNIYKDSVQLIGAALIITALFCFIIFSFMLKLMSAIIVKPFGQLVNEVNDIGLESLNTLPVDKHKSKEFVFLVDSFNNMLSRIKADRDAIEEKEIAEKASRAKGEFLSSMSHEIRTPMNAIIGMVGIARKSGDIHRIEYCLEKIDSSSKYLLGLINDILDISKIEANKLELSPAEFDFERMLMNITNVVNFRVEEKKQNLIINIDKEVPPILIGDEMRLGQVIANLLSNAVKFTPEGGIITLNAHMNDMWDGMYELLFEVIDNGIGISKAQQAKLFTPFEQADGDITRKYGGTGLGLTISKGIVELMGGRIWIESELGQGAKFSLTVKMNAGKSFPRPELAKIVDKDNIRILVVDGTPEIRNYFTRLMPELGLKCDVSGSGTEVLEKIKENSYNFFFVDCMLPGLNGVELTKMIKGISRDNTVIMTIPQNDWSNIEKDAAAAGVNRFIFKPFFASTLIDAINKSVGVMPEVKKPEDKTLEYNFKGHTLLVAEDVEINREIIFAVLEDTQISIDFAQDGAQALSMFENDPNRYSLIFMDIQMPEMDGYEATQRIRALGGSKAKSIPIIAMTANVFREDVEKCMEAGMNDHVSKPIDTTELLCKLDKHLNSELPVTKS